jgi:hypothetical protein
MAWTAQLIYAPGWPEAPEAVEVILTGTSTGKGPPRYDWGEQIEPEVRLGYGAQLEEFYREGLYGTGSPGQVRDMLHAMHRLSTLYAGMFEMRVPEATQRKAEQEAEADAAELPQGAVW